MTTATILGRASRVADQIDAEAGQLDPRKVLLTLAMVIPFLIGWVIGQVFRTVWAVLAWTWTAGVVGFRTAQGGGRDAPG